MAAVTLTFEDVNDSLSSSCSLLTHSPPPSSPFILSQVFRDSWLLLQVVERSIQQLPRSCESTDEICQPEDFLVIPDLPPSRRFPKSLSYSLKKVLTVLSAEPTLAARIARAAVGRGWGMCHRSLTSDQKTLDLCLNRLPIVLGSGWSPGIALCREPLRSPVSEIESPIFCRERKETGEGSACLSSSDLRGHHRMSQTGGWTTRTLFLTVLQAGGARSGWQHGGSW